MRLKKAWLDIFIEPCTWHKFYDSVLDQHVVYLIHIDPEELSIIDRQSQIENRIDAHIYTMLRKLGRPGLDV